MGCGAKWSNLGAVMVWMVLCSVGCLSRTAAKRFYYTISYEPLQTEVPGSQRPYPYSVQVNQFSVSRLYSRSQILYRYSVNEIRYYGFRHWAIRPDDMITSAVLKHLTSANLFTEVGTHFLERRPDYYLNGEATALERYDSGDTWYAHLAMTLRLIDAQDGTQVWQYSFDDRRPVFQPEMVYTVNALSELMQMHMDRVVRELDELCQASLSKGRLVRQARAVRGKAAEVRTEESSEPGLLDEDSYVIVPGKRMPVLEDTLGSP